MIESNKIISDYRMNAVNGPADLDQRLSSLDVTQSCIVTAPAGSGKTELLAQRYLALLSIVNEPEEILAITFTNKSGNEMRNRVINALSKADSESMPESSHEQLTWKLAKNALERSKEKDWNIMLNPNRLCIKTNDAFNGSLARKAPIVGEMGGAMNITDNYQSCYLQAARDLLSELEIDNEWSSSLETILSHVDNRFYRAEELMVGLLEKREHWLPLVLQAKGTHDLRLKLESVLKIIASDIISSIKEDLSPYQSSIVDISTFAYSNTPSGKCNAILPLQHIADSGSLPGSDSDDLIVWESLYRFLFTTTGSPRKSATAAIGFPAPSSEKDKEVKALLSSKKEQYKLLLGEFDDAALVALEKLRFLPPVTYKDDEWDILNCLLKILPVLAAKLLLVFQREGVVDHSEISSSALRVLGSVDEPTDLALILDAQIKHILIDEFQDTNNIQMNSLEMLTAGWEVNDGRSLFLVGDPMQSIYSFRGSNVGLFIDVARNGVGDLLIKPIELSVNFRSQETLVSWVNEIFTNLLPDTSDSNLGSIPYAKSIPQLPAKPHGKSVSLVGFTGDIDTSREFEGVWISEKIEEIHNTNRGQTIAILVRNRSALKSTIQALSVKKIPYQAIDIDALIDQNIIRDLASLTKAICHLGDRIAWLSLLRSPLCGVNLSDLEIIASTKDSIILDNLKNAKITCAISNKGRAQVNLLVSVIKNSLRWRERKTLLQIIKGSWISLCGPSSLEGESGIENTQAFFDVLEKFTHSSFNSDAFNASLSHLYASPDSQANNNPVQIMTLHKSKGLEFDHVFIPGCERQSRNDDTTLLACDRFMSANGTVLSLMSASPEIGGETNPLYLFIKKQRNDRANLERDRILYVGCTRAKDQLYLTCNLAVKDGDISPPAARSFMGSLWPQVSGDIEFIPVDSTYSILNSPSGNTQAVCPDSGIPELPMGNILSDYRGRMAADNSNVQNVSWSPDYSNLIGIQVHRILRRICLDNFDVWCDEGINAKKEAWRHQLLQRGVPALHIHSVIHKVVAWIKGVLADSKALWFLDNSHRESNCELSVSGVIIDKTPQTIIIDRTFISDGIRWIIDYKTATPGNHESNEDFELRMIKEFGPQLDKYKSHMNDMGPEPIRCAIYIVSIQKFIELNNSALIDKAA